MSGQWNVATPVAVAVLSLAQLREAPTQTIWEQNWNLLE